MLFRSFLSIHNTLQSTKFTPPQCQLVKFCICAELLDTKLSEKSNFETPKVSRLKHEIQARYISLETDNVGKGKSTICPWVSEDEKDM